MLAIIFQKKLFSPKSLQNSFFLTTFASQLSYMVTDENFFLRKCDFFLKMTENRQFIKKIVYIFVTIFFENSVQY